MKRQTSIAPGLSSFAAPSASDKARFAALTDEEKLQLVEAEIAKGLSGGSVELNFTAFMAEARSRRHGG